MVKKYKVLQLMSYPVMGILQFVDENHPYHGHNLYGYLTFRNNPDFDIEWYPKKSINPFFIGKNIVVRRLLAQIQCLFSASKYDLIYSPHDIHILPLAILRYLGILKTPILMVCHFSYNMNYVHSGFSRILKRIERYFVFRAVDQVLWADKELMNLGMENFKVPEKHQKVANWGANLEFFDSYIKNIGRASRQNYFASMGWANRDYATLCEAIKNMDLQLKILAGKRSIPNSPHNVEFVDLSKYGMAGMAHLREFYYDAIAICLPIAVVNDVPNGATVLIEALAMGKPLLVTDSPTNYIDVERERVGIKVARNDVDGWRKALCYCIEHPEACKIWGGNARKLAEQRLNLRIFEDNVSREIKKMCAK